jgi:hypothetical protein
VCLKNIINRSVIYKCLVEWMRINVMEMKQSKYDNIVDSMDVDRLMIYV